MTNRIDQQVLGVVIGVLALLVAFVFNIPAVSYAVTLVLVVLTFLQPKTGILLLFVYFPARALLIEVAPSLKLVGDLVIISAFLRIVWEQRKNWKSIFHFEKFEWAFILFIIVGALASLLNDVSIGAIVFQIRAFVITFLLIYIVKRMTITKEDVRHFLWITFAMALVIVLQGFIEKLSMRSAWMPEKWINRQLSPGNASRIYGVLNNPNVLSVYITMAAILTIYLKRLMKPAKWVTIFFYISLVLMSGIWIMTYSRGTWIAVALGLVLYTLYTRKWKFAIKVVLVLGLSFGAVALPTTYAAQWIQQNTEIGNFERTGEEEVGPSVGAIEAERIGETFTGSTFEKSMTTGRLYVVFKGFEVYKDYPIIGSGFATFGDSATKSYLSPIYADYGITTNIYADNQYIEIIAQNGTIGVILFASFLLGMLWLFWKKRHDTPVAIPLVVSLLAIFWCGLVYNIWEDKTFTLYYYTLTGAFIAFIRAKEQGNDSTHN